MKKNPTEELLPEERYAIESFIKREVAAGTLISVPSRFPTLYGTGAHISKGDPSMLAWYPTKRHVIERKAQQIKPGRYLKKCFPTLSDDEIRMATALFNEEYRLVFVDTFQDIYLYYRALHTSGIVKSCMSKALDYNPNEDDEDEEHDWPEDYHPLEVYHNSDVGLAVMLDPQGRPKARALYNKVTKQFPMVYGEWERMHALLVRSGFTHGPLDGAKINRIPIVEGVNHTEALLPYIDHVRPLDRSLVANTYVKDHGSHLEINYLGVYSACEYDTGVVTLFSKGVSCRECANILGNVDDVPKFPYACDYLLCPSCAITRTAEILDENGILTRIPIEHLCNCYKCFRVNSQGYEEITYFYSKSRATQFGYQELVRDAYQRLYDVSSYLEATHLPADRRLVQIKNMHIIAGDTTASYMFWDVQYLCANAHYNLEQGQFELHGYTKEGVVPVALLPRLCEFKDVSLGIPFKCWEDLLRYQQVQVGGGLTTT